MIDQRVRTAWPWLLGASLLVVVVVMGLRRTEGEEFLALSRQARPAWLVLAMFGQVMTYVVQAEVWLMVTRAARARLSRGAASELSVAKLFVDQALPSAGVSSTVLLVSALDRRQVPRPVSLAAAALNLTSYHAAYTFALGAALMMAIDRGWVHGVAIGLALVTILFLALVTAGLLMFAGRRPDRRLVLLERIPLLGRGLRAVEQADRRLVTRPALLAGAIAAQLTIMALDTFTLVVLLQSLGARVPLSAAFVGVMVGSVFRTIGVVPGGLGTFEAGVVLALHAAGLAVSVALSATLLFRGLSFWIPMLPGWWCARRVVARHPAASIAPPPAYWALAAEELLRMLGSTSAGLSNEEAARRLDVQGAAGFNAPPPSFLRVVARQLRSPLLWLLIFAAVVSAATGEWSDAAVVCFILMATVVIGAQREGRAERAVDALRSRVRSTATVVRDHATSQVAGASVVTGDVLHLQAGSLVPADAVILESHDVFVNEAALTGESEPVEKRAGAIAPDTPLARRTNCVFVGTDVRSGTAVCVAVSTGGGTELGHIAERVSRDRPESDFDRGIRHFGYLLTAAMLVLVPIVFLAHLSRGHAVIETLLFSVALAVGLSPELLPAMVTMNLARGARLMAVKGVLVKRLAAIENLGSMTVLCTDKTGTLTEGRVRCTGSFGPDGTADPGVLVMAAINARLQSGLNNPLDDAILEARPFDAGSARKLSEIPFDFERRRLSVITAGKQGAQIITKGAFASIAPICTQLADGSPLDAECLARLTTLYTEWSRQGIRVLAVATSDLPVKDTYGRGDEAALSFAGFVTLFDQPKLGVDKALRQLRHLGVVVKIITGDNRLVAGHVASLVKFDGHQMMTGEELATLDDAALRARVTDTSMFVEVDPEQKERIIVALRAAGHVVGFMGDGVNDAPAMHAADTSLSVQEAVDVAREAADFVLLDRHLDVIRRGIEEGRRTFANTMKYILITTSANLGNMMSMAAASLVLPFLPLLAGQILLNNLLSDVPAVGLADDRVDPEMVRQPPRWDMRVIGRFMVVFGAISSLFDVLTFGVLLRVFQASVELFRTSWFVESLMTELVIALVVRTRRPAFRSRPGRLLLMSSLVMMAITPVIPWLPGAERLGFVPIPGVVLAALGGIVVAYVFATELAKVLFYRVGAGRHAG